MHEGNSDTEGGIDPELKKELAKWLESAPLEKSDGRRSIDPELADWVKKSAGTPLEKRHGGYPETRVNGDPVLLAGNWLTADLDRTTEEQLINQVAETRKRTFLGKIPVLSALFSSKKPSKNTHINPNDKAILDDMASILTTPIPAYSPDDELTSWIAQKNPLPNPSDETPDISSLKPPKSNMVKRVERRLRLEEAADRIQAAETSEGIEKPLEEKLPLQHVAVLSDAEGRTTQCYILRHYPQQIGVFILEKGELSFRKIPKSRFDFSQLSLVCSAMNDRDLLQLKLALSMGDELGIGIEETAEEKLAREEAEKTAEGAGLLLIASDESATDFSVAEAAEDGDSDDDSWLISKKPKVESGAELPAEKRETDIDDQEGTDVDLEDERGTALNNPDDETDVDFDAETEEGMDVDLEGEIAVEEDMQSTDQ